MADILTAEELEAFATGYLYPTWEPERAEAARPKLVHLLQQVATAAADRVREEEQEVHRDVAARWIAERKAMEARLVVATLAIDRTDQALRRMIQFYNDEALPDTEVAGHPPWLREALDLAEAWRREG